MIMSKEGVTQGDPLAMICYGLASLPLIRSLKEENASWRQVWYADDAGIYGKLQDIRRVYLDLATKGPKWGYIPEPSKSILVIREESFESAKNILGDLNFKVQSGARYLGGFVGDEKKKEE